MLLEYIYGYYAVEAQYIISLVSRETGKYVIHLPVVGFTCTFTHMVSDFLKNKIILILSCVQIG